MVCEALLTRTLLGKRLARLAGREALDDVTVARLSVLAALHDIGKFNHGFQDKAQQRPAAVAGHVKEMRAALDDRPDGCPMLYGPGGLSALDGWDGDEDEALGLLIAAISHHGEPAVREPIKHRLWQAQAGRDPVAGIAALVERTRDWFPTAWLQGPNLPKAPEFHHGFAGVVVLADWLGSDTRWFAFGDPDVPRGPFARKKARELVSALHLDAHDARAMLLARDLKFEGWTGFTPRGIQELVVCAPLPQPGSVEIVESETGSGKTEAAFARFAQLHGAGLVDGLYFALPTRTAATQLHKRMDDLVRKAFGDGPAKPPVVLAVPGYLRVDADVGQRMAGYEVLWSENRGWPESASRWSAEQPKQYLASAIAVGTIDQVLLASLQVNHAHLRATALLRQLLVIDEVHASDPYMEVLLRQVLAWHVRAGGHALLLSATLGGELRARLLAPGARRVAAPSLAEAIAVPYPLFSTPAGAVAVQTAGAPKAIRVEALGAIDDPVAVATLAAVAARAGAKVLIVRNTVAACLATQEALEHELAGEQQLLFGVAVGGKRVAAPHHSRYAPQDRTLLDQAIEATFGKAGDRGSGCVAVATQTVQQSLDLDADLLISDICPMDVLLQRIGRLHRHQRPARPKGCEEPRAIVLVPADRDLRPLIGKDKKARGPSGIGSVYEDLRMIEATWQQIEQRPDWQLPAMNRALVEQSLHSEALAAVAGADPAWLLHGQGCAGTVGSQRSIAHVAKLDFGKPFEECAFARDDGSAATTRLGAKDRALPLSEPRRSPFAALISSLNLPGWQAQGIADDAVALDTVEPGGSLRVDFGPLQLRYDRWGLRLATATPAGEDLDG
jgi:CRISPR-associated endonuclease/helicase Cas3